MTEQTRKKAKSVTITWEDGVEETLTVGDEGDVFIVWTAEEGGNNYNSTWSGGILLFNTVMAAAIQFRARLHVHHIKDQDRQMVDRFIEDALGGEEEG